jgi:hypothetical protein
VSSSIQDLQTSQRWNFATRIAFRFTFVYSFLYISARLGSYIPYLGKFIEEGESTFWSVPVPWVNKHILHLSYDLTVNRVTGGDRPFDYVQVFSCLLVAAIVSLVWSLLDRKRLSYLKLYEWLKLAIRFWLVVSLTVYGFAKAPVPAQMQQPELVKLVQPYGDFTPMGILWSFIGSSPTYEIITGYIELLGGVLLILPRTTLLGAVIAFVAMTQVFVLNLCYDVYVKLYSFHLLMGTVFLLAPHLGRLANLFVFNRPVEPANTSQLFDRPRLNRAALAIQVMLGLYILGANFLQSRQENQIYYGSPRPPLFGIYTVEDYSVNGESRPPLLTDATRWKRVIFDSENRFYIQPMNGENQAFLVQVDQEKKTITLKKRRDKNWKAELAFDEPEPGQIVIEGQLDDQHSKARLVRFDESKFLLRSRGFKWIQEYSFNR